MRESHGSAGSCIPTTRVEPVTKIHVLYRDGTWELSVLRPTLHPLSQTGFGQSCFFNGARVSIGEDGKHDGDDGGLVPTTVSMSIMPLHCGFKSSENGKCICDTTIQKRRKERKDRSSNRTMVRGAQVT